MQTSLKGLLFIASLEGCCLSKYYDSVSVATIGIGATKTEIPNLPDWPMGKTITIQEAFTLLKKSVAKYENAINKAITVPLQQWQFDALVSWCYNVGIGWPPKASVIRHLNNGDAKEAVYKALMMFNQPKEIIGRRTKEAILLTTGKYSGEGKVLVFPVTKNGHPQYSKGYEINAEEYLTEEDS